MNKLPLILYLLLQATVYASYSPQKPNFQLSNALNACYIALADLAEAAADHQAAVEVHNKQHSSKNSALVSLKRIDWETAIEHYNKTEQRYVTLKKHLASAPSQSTTPQPKIDLSKQTALPVLKDEEFISPENHRGSTFVTKEEIQLPKILKPRLGILCLKPEYYPTEWK